MSFHARTPPAHRPSNRSHGLGAHSRLRYRARALLHRSDPREREAVRGGRGRERGRGRGGASCGTGHIRRGTSKPEVVHRERELPWQPRSALTPGRSSVFRVVQKRSIIRSRCILSIPLSLSLVWGRVSKKRKRQIYIFLNVVRLQNFSKVSR